MMKSTDIRFFSPAENSVAKEKKTNEPKAKKIALTGHISNTGKLVLPAKTVAELGIAVANKAFKIGTDQGKRKAKSLYLVPANGDQSDSFQFEKGAKSLVLSLPRILQKSGVDFSNSKYSFTIQLFDYEGTTAFELRLSQQAAAPKAPYTGKPRGRKPKAKDVEQ